MLRQQSNLRHATGYDFALQVEQSMKQNIVGKTIKSIRMSRNITQEVMVARLQSSGMDMSRSTYSKVEAQLRQVRDVELIAFAKALGVPIEELFKDL